MKARSSQIESVSWQDTGTLAAVVMPREVGVHRNVAVSGGLCIPKGVLKGRETLRAALAGSSSEVQAEVLNRWSDGSVRWLLASCILPEIQAVADERPSLTDRPIRPIPVAFSFVSDANSVSSGDSLTVLKHGDGEIRMTTRRLTDVVPGEQTICIRPVVTTPQGDSSDLIIESVSEEVAGPVRQIFVISARLRNSPFLTIQLRLIHWAAIGLVQVETRIRNTRRARHQGGLWDLGDPGSFLFGSLSLQIRSTGITDRATVRWRCERDQPLRSASPRQSVRIHQFGSGGRWWNSSNHTDSDQECPVPARGYEANGPDGVLRGYRAEPLITMCDEQSFLAAAIPEFWQQFPGSVEVSGGRLNVGLFPITETPHELQGGEQKTQSIWIQTGTGEPDLSTLNWTFHQPRLMQTANDYQRADVFPWFPGAAKENDSSVSGETDPKSAILRHDDCGRLQHYLRQAVTGSHSPSARREKIDEYGWRNYGDVPADHEQLHYPGSGTVISHYNNQFDMIYGGILQLAATGDPVWLDLFDPLARHVLDIDIYHTSEDRAAFSGGMFWHTDHYADAATSTHRTYSSANQRPGLNYGGGPSCEHNYTTGLLYYYFLTGHPEAYQAVISLAEWVIRMDDGRNTVFGLLDDGPTGYASATVFEDFHGPGRGAGNSVNALLDAWILTQSLPFLEKAEELIRRCVHPKQDLYSLHLADAEGHWSYTVFLTALGRYLLVKSEAGMLDGMYDWARQVMRHYGRWMAVNETRTLSQPERLQYPTEAWAAQDFRKANALRLAAACDDDPRQAAAMRSRARELNNMAWDDLYSFGEGHLTARCLSILMTEGQRDLFHRTVQPESMPSAQERYPDCVWTMFIPQKTRVREMLRSPAGILRASVRAISPPRIFRMIRALTRQL